MTVVVLFVWHRASGVFYERQDRSSMAAANAPSNKRPVAGIGTGDTV
jgi:hypothetical protein